MVLRCFVIVIMEKKYVPAPSEGFREFNFINSARIATKFDTVVTVGEGFKINMFESVIPLFSGLSRGGGGAPRARAGGGGGG